MGVDVHFIFGSNSFQFLAVRGDRVGGIFHLGRNLGPIRLDFWYFGALELIGSLFGRNFGSIRLNFWCFGVLELIGSPILKGFFGGTGQKFGFEMNLILTT